MGFGLLLVGYVFAFVATIGMGPYAFAGALRGGFIMFLTVLFAFPSLYSFTIGH